MFVAAETFSSRPEPPDPRQLMNCIADPRPYMTGARRSRNVGKPSWTLPLDAPVGGSALNRLPHIVRAEGVSSMAITETQILDALRAVRLPAGVGHGGGDLVAAGMVSGLTLREGHVGFAIEVDPTQATVMEPVRKAAEKAVVDLPGVLT